MLTTLRRVALALALVLPTSAVANPLNEGDIVTIPLPLVTCLSPDSAVSLAEQMIASEPELDMGDCTLSTAPGPLFVGRSQSLGIAPKAFGEPREIWVIEMTAGTETRLVLMAFPPTPEGSL